MRDNYRVPTRVGALEVGLELALQRAVRQVGRAASIAEDLGRQSLMEDLQNTKGFLEQALDEVQRGAHHRRFVAQLRLPQPPASPPPPF